MLSQPKDPGQQPAERSKLAQPQAFPRLCFGSVYDWVVN